MIKPTTFNSFRFLLFTLFTLSVIKVYSQGSDIGKERKFERYRVKEKISEDFKVNGPIQKVEKLPTDRYWSYSNYYRVYRLFIFPVAVQLRIYGQSYNEKLGLTEQKRIKIDKQYKVESFYGIEKVGKDYYLLFSTYDKKKKKEYLYAGLFDPYDLRIEEEPQRIAYVKSIRSRRYYPAKFEIQHSENDEYLVVMPLSSKKIRRTKWRPFKKKKAQKKKPSQHTFKFTFMVFDDKMKRVNYQKNHKVIVEESSNKFYLDQLDVDEEGSVYIIGKTEIIDEKSRSEKSKSKAAIDIEVSKYVVEKITAEGEKSQYVTPEEDLIMDLDMTLDQNHLQLTAMTGNQSYNRLICTGVERIMLEKDGLEEEQVLQDNFEEKILDKVNNIVQYEEGLSKRKKKRYDKRKARQESKMSMEEKEFNEIKRKGAINVNRIAFSGFNEEGEGYVVLEEYLHRVVTNTYTDANGNVVTTTTHYYHYNDLIICRFDEDGVEQQYFNKAETYVNMKRPVDLTGTITEEGDLQLFIEDKLYLFDSDLEDIARAEPTKLTGEKKVLPALGKNMVVHGAHTDDNELLFLLQSTGWFKNKRAWVKIKP